MFFDLKKAFDSVPHRALLDKLKSLQLNDHILKWVCDYLKDRKQRVVVNGEISETLPVLSGVPQGSVIGPLLFLIYIDDVLRVPLSEGSRLTVYADDMLLYKPISCQEDFAALQNDIDKLEFWTATNQLQFNTSKCKYMVVSRKRAGILPPPLTLQGQLLQQVDHFKYLGLLLSSDLSWSSHVENICNKARKLLGLLYRQYYQLAEPNTLLQLYLSLIRPHLEYASPVWNPYLRKKHSHSGECTQICPQDVFQTVGSGICPAVRDVCGSCTLRPQTLFRPVHSVQNCTWLLLFSS